MMVKHELHGCLSASVVDSFFLPTLPVSVLIHVSHAKAIVKINDFSFPEISVTKRSF